VKSLLAQVLHSDFNGGSNFGVAGDDERAVKNLGKQRGILVTVKLVKSQPSVGIPTDCVAAPRVVC
jgi:hypothetical protein